MNDVQVTEAAARRIQDQLGKRGHGLGLRLGVRSSGCSGFAYVLDYADEQGAADHVIESHGVKLFIEDDSWPMLKGVTLDYRREGINEAFKFDNPNVTDLCGCGESFSISKDATEA